MAHCLVLKYVAGGAAAVLLHIPERCDQNPYTRYS